MRKFSRNILFILGLVTAISTVPVRAQTPAGTAITNTAFVQFDDGSGETRSLPSDTVVTIVGEGTLWITKEVNREKAAIGDTIMYTIRIRNVDSTPTYNVTVRDTLAQMLSYVSSQPNGVRTGRVIEWYFPQINAGETIYMQLKCQVIKAAYQDSIDNVVSYSTSSGTWLYSNTVYTAWEPWPEGTVEKSVTPQKVYVGDTLTYSFRLQNTGSMLLTKVRLQDPLPRGVEYLDSAFPVDTSNQTVTWNIGPMTRNRSVNMEFRAIVMSEAENGSLMNRVYFNSAQGVLDSSRAAVDFLGYGIGLEITKEAPQTTYIPGDTVVYDLILKNTGIRSGHNVVVRDTLPEHLDYINATHNVQKEENVLSWSFEDMEAGFHDTLHVYTTIHAPIEHETVINNEVWARASDGVQDSSHWQISVNSYPEFTLEKKGPSKVVPGEIFSYDIIYTNVGTATAFQPLLCDTLSEMLRFVSASDSYTLSVDSQAVEWILPCLAPGESDTVIISVSLSQNIRPGDKITNVAWLSDREMSGVSVATASCVSVSEPAGPGFYTYKKVDRQVATIGDTLMYTVYVGLYNQVNTDSVVIYDKLPEELTWIDNSVTYKLSSVVAVFDPLTNELTITMKEWDIGKTDSVQVKAIVDETFSPGVQLIDNTALVIMNNDTLSTADDLRSNAETRLVESFLSVKKTVNHKMSEVGDILTYTVTVENKSSDDPLSLILVEDILPEGFRYLEKSSVLDSVNITDPVSNNMGEQVRLQWTLQDTLNPGKVIRLRYRVTVSLSVTMGEHENRVTASGDVGDGVWIKSNIATAAVLIRAGILDTRGFIFGKVYQDLNHSGQHDNGEPGLKGVELILEDGTRVTTDEYGKYSIPNVEYGQHVLRLNERTLPEGSQNLSEGPEFMGDPTSQLIRLSPGGMAKANFIIRVKDQSDRAHETY
ncbi:MAG: hypothetical protein R6V04_07740 [bacterium]